MTDKPLVSEEEYSAAVEAYYAGSKFFHRTYEPELMAALEAAARVRQQQEKKKESGDANHK